MGRKHGQSSRKRTKSVVSPESVSENQVSKRLNMADQRSPHGFSELSELSQLYGSAMNSLVDSPSSQLGTINTNYSTSTNSIANGISPAHHYPGIPPMSQTQNPMSQQVHPQPFPVCSPPSYQQIVLDKLESMNRKLSKLDSIEVEMKKITQKVAVLDSRLTILESGVNEQKRTITDIEASRNYDADVCRNIELKQREIEKSIQTERILRENIAKTCDKLERENKRLSEEVVDLQARSMRENLLFFGFPEEPTPDSRNQENCKAKIISFCRNTLEMDDPDTIKLDRVHRLGRFKPNKERAIVAKFHDPPVKVAVKDKAALKLKSTTFRVSDQYPRTVQERRRELIPELRRKRQEGYDAILSYDKLIVRGRRRDVSQSTNESRRSSEQLEQSSIRPSECPSGLPCARVSERLPAASSAALMMDTMESVELSEEPAGVEPVLPLNELESCA